MFLHQLDPNEGPVEETTTTEFQLFDYTSLDPETRVLVQECSDEVKGLIKPQAKDIIEAGQKLIEVKNRLGHGRFGNWLQTEFGRTSRTAQNYMRVAEVFKYEKSSYLKKFSYLDIAPSALCHLAKSSTPDEARQEALDRAYQGEHITHAEAKAIANKYKPSASSKQSNTVKPISQKVLPALYPISARPTFSGSPVTIDICAESISAQGSITRSTSERGSLPNQQIVSLPADEFHKRVEPEQTKLATEPFSAQIHISNVEWYEPQLLDDAQTLKIPLCMWLKGPSYVLPALFEQIKEDPETRELVCTGLSRSIQVIVDSATFSGG